MRWSRSSLLVFAAALLASLSIHLPVYEMLGVLARAWEEETASRERTPPSQIEFEMADTPEEKAEPEPQLKEQEKRAEAEKAKRPEPKPEKAKPQPEQKKREPAKPELPKPELVVTPPPQPTKPIENKLAVTQKTDDPNVPPPENSRFIAEENRRVEEEMIASVRSLTENDEQPNASAPKPEDEQLGNAKEEKAAELQNVKGEDSRIPDKREAKEKPLSPSQMGKGDKQSEAVAHAHGEGDNGGAADQHLRGGQARRWRGGERG